MGNGFTFVPHPPELPPGCRVERDEAGLPFRASTQASSLYYDRDWRHYTLLFNGQVVRGLGIIEYDRREGWVMAATLAEVALARSQGTEPPFRRMPGKVELIINIGLLRGTH